MAGLLASPWPIIYSCLGLPFHPLVSAFIASCSAPFLSSNRLRRPDYSPQYSPPLAMSAHLQFGPEWMRKGRGKTSTAIGAASAGGDAASPLQENVAPLVSSSAAASKSASAGTTGKRLPSLGNLSSGPASVAPSAATPSPGTFSFAAAAQAGSTRDSTQSSTSSSAIQQHSSEGDSARYSKRLLSLYSSERGAKGSASGQDSSSSATVQGSKVRAE